MNISAWLRRRQQLVTCLGLFLICLILFPSIMNVQADPQRDWTTYLGSNTRTNFAANESDINASNVGNLQLDWKYSTKGNITSQPLYVAGIGHASIEEYGDANPEIIWGSWDGNEYATDHYGNLAWSTYLGQSFTCNNQPRGVGSTATIMSGNYDKPHDQNSSVAYVGGGDGKLYALDASSGNILWKTQLSAIPKSFIWSSPAVYNGSVYIGVASLGDCPLVRGALVQVNATTGAIQHRFDTVPSGCLGGDIWSSPTIAMDTGTIFVTTGNPGQCSSHEKYAEAIVALRASDLSVTDYWQVPPSQQITDGDFGATPTLFWANIGGSARRMIGMANKNGTYYAFLRYGLHNGPVWKTQIGTSHKDISSSAWDGSTLYVGSETTTIEGQSCLGSLRALDPATGKFKWQDCFNDGVVFTPISAIPGVLFVGEGPHFLALDAATGNILFNYKTAALIDAPATISNGEVLIGDSAGNLYAFRH